MLVLGFFNAASKMIRPYNRILQDLFLNTMTIKCTWIVFTISASYV